MTHWAECRAWPWYGKCGMAWMHTDIQPMMYMPAIRTIRWYFQPSGSTAAIRVSRRDLRLLWSATLPGPV